MHQPEVALLDQVEQGEPGSLLLLRNGHDQSQVRLHQRLRSLVPDAIQFAQLLRPRRREGVAGLELRPRVAAVFDRTRQPNLVVPGEQGVSTDVMEVQPDEVLIFAVDSHLRHCCIPRLGCPPLRTASSFGRPNRNPVLAPCEPFGLWHAPLRATASSWSAPPSSHPDAMSSLVRVIFATPAARPSPSVVFRASYAMRRRAKPGPFPIRTTACVLELTAVFW